MSKVINFPLDAGYRMPFTDDMILALDDGLKVETRRPAKYKTSGELAKCPYGQRGDLILITGAHIFLAKDGTIATERKDRNRLVYRVDWTGEIEVPEWRPPMFLPKDSVNRVVMNDGVSLVKLCDITEEQAITEGIRKVRKGVGGAAEPFFTWDPRSKIFFTTARAAFEDLWNNIYGERGLFFGTNPDVWRIKLAKVDPEKLKCR